MMTVGLVVVVMYSRFGWCLLCVRHHLVSSMYACNMDEVATTESGTDTCMFETSCWLDSECVHYIIA